MVNQQPALVPVHKEVRGKGLSGFHALAEAVGYILKTAHPGQNTLNSHGDEAQLNADFTSVTENALPAFGNVVPADNQAPAGVDTLDPVLVQPDFGHLREVQRFERAVKSLIHLENL